MKELIQMSITAKGNIGVYNARYSRNPAFIMHTVRMNRSFETYQEFTEHIHNSINDNKLKDIFSKSWNKIMKKEKIKLSDELKPGDVNDFCVLIFS